jgi:hypothetical protein
MDPTKSLGKYFTSHVGITSGATGHQAGIISNSSNSSLDISTSIRNLQTSVEKINERLNILTIDKELEREWEELAELGKKYRELESYILETNKAWKILSK